MTNSRQTFMTFLFAGFVSGIGSGLSAAVPPVGLFFTGIFFGIAISQATHQTLTPLTWILRLALIAASAVAWFVAMAVAILSNRIADLGNGYIAGGWGGAFGGGAGAFLVALALIIVVSDLRPLQSLVVITATGAILGSISAIIGIAIADHTPLGRLYATLVPCLIWQTGVARSIPSFYDTPEEL